MTEAYGGGYHRRNYSKRRYESVFKGDFMKLQKLLKKLALPVFALVVVGMLAACSSPSGGGSGSGSGTGTGTENNGDGNGTGTGTGTGEHGGGTSEHHEGSGQHNHDGENGGSGQQGGTTTGKYKIYYEGKNANALVMELPASKLGTFASEVGLTSSDYEKDDSKKTILVKKSGIEKINDNKDLVEDKYSEYFVTAQDNSKEPSKDNSENKNDDSTTTTSSIDGTYTGTVTGQMSEGITVFYATVVVANDQYTVKMWTSPTKSGKADIEAGGKISNKTNATFTGAGSNHSFQAISSGTSWNVVINITQPTVGVFSGTMTKGSSSASNSETTTKPGDDGEGSSEASSLIDWEDCYLMYLEFEPQTKPQEFPTAFLSVVLKDIDSKDYVKDDTNKTITFKTEDAAMQAFSNLMSLESEYSD